MIDDGEVGSVVLRDSEGKSGKDVGIRFDQETSLMRFEFSQHAKEGLIERGIPQNLIESVLHAPQQILPEYGGRRAYQSIVTSLTGTRLLLRAIVEDDVEPAMVVTVYWTRKIAKYWRTT